MNSRFGAYPSYRDAGIDWIGKVPAEWVVLATARISDLTTGERDTRDAMEDGAYPFFVRSQTVERINSYSFDGEAVLTSGDGAGVGKIFHHHVGKLEFHQRVYLFHNFRRITGRFFFYFFREHLHRVALAGNAKSTVDSLRRPMLRMFPVCLPSVEEQTRIVEFLDYETAKIDALIEKQQQLIELLKEKRQAVISHAVTKGLNPDVPMRDSGVEWLGEVPSHWRVVPLKWATKRLQTGSTPPTDIERFYLDGTLPWHGPSSFGEALVVGSPVKLICECAIQEGKAREFGVGTVLVVAIGATIGKSALADARCSANQQITGLEFPRASVLPEYAALGVRRLEEVFRRRAQYTTMPIMNQQEIGVYLLAIPPAAEQSEIVSSVSRRLDAVDDLVERAQDMASILQERRTALISAAVTGKIDVRGWNPPVGDADAEVA